jgi:hypothetical protein
MILNFPRPYQDELLYSWIARYHWLMRHESHQCTMRLLFDCPSVKVGIGFPTRLSVFGRRIGIEVSEVDTIMRSHTLLPLYAPFLPPERLIRVETALKGLATNASLLGFGADGLSVDNPKHLRFCPVCASDERKATGEAYWHRLHQAAGVQVCPVHNVFLQESSAPWKALHRMNAAEAVITGTTPNPIDIENPDHRLLRKIALNVEWLLSNWSSGNTVASLHERYWVLAFKKGFVSPARSILWKKVMPVIENRYSKSFLSTLQCTVPDDPADYCYFWLANLLKGTERVQPPIRHLLLMDLLEVELAELFRIKSAHEVLGCASQECQNPVCPKTGTKSVQTSLSYSWHQKIPTLRVLCPECGQESYRITRSGRTWIDIIGYGHVWDSKLRCLWMDRTVTIKQMVQTLQVTHQTLKRQAARLDLPFPREGAGRIAGKSGPPCVMVNSKRILADRGARRNEWLAIVASYPGEARCEVRARAPRCFDWLKKHDPDWLAQHCPAPIRPTSPWVRARSSSAPSLKRDPQAPAGCA